MKSSLGSHVENLHTHFFRPSFSFNQQLENYALENFPINKNDYDKGSKFIKNEMFFWKTKIRFFILHILKKQKKIRLKKIF